MDEELELREVEQFLQVHTVEQQYKCDWNPNLCQDYLSYLFCQN